MPNTATDVGAAEAAAEAEPPRREGAAKPIRPRAAAMAALERGAVAAAAAAAGAGAPAGAGAADRLPPALGRAPRPVRAAPRQRPQRRIHSCQAASGWRT